MQTQNDSKASERIAKLSEAVGRTGNGAETMPGTPAGSVAVRKADDHCWRCACGEFTAELVGPPVFNFNCHCHSCVAPARFLDSKFPASRSALVDGKGVGKAFWLLENIKLPDGGLSFVKVGDAGQNIRAYASCCGTLFNTAGGKQFPVPARPLARSGVMTSAGHPYAMPSESMCGDCLTKFAFDDYELPTGHHDTMSPQLSAAFGECGSAPSPVDIDPAWLKVGSDVEEVVPITWE